MVINVAGLIIGLVILCGGLFYLIKEKNDSESKKIYGITSGIGIIITIIFALRLFVL